MPVNFDPSADLAALADGTEPVTLLRRGSTPGSPGTVVAQALRQAATTGEATIHNRYDTEKKVPSDGRVTATDVVWHLPVTQLAAAPGLGDVILDGDGRRWTILDVQLATLQTRWRCSARDLTLAHGLDDTLTVLRAVYAKGAGGAAEPTWIVWKTGVRARIQRSAADVGARNQSRQTTTRCRILLAETLALDHNHRLKGPDGTFYRVLAAAGAERIGELMTIDAETIV